jgi:hypothetical protein
MDNEAFQAIKRDFMDWSGGFPPESDHEISVYIEAAKPTDSSDAELWALLRMWMNEENYGKATR